MSRTMRPGDQPAYRVVFPARYPGRTYSTETAYGPYATLGVARATLTRETGRYGDQAGRTDGRIERSDTRWTEVEE